MKLACIFTDHMVLQANQSVRVFGEGIGSVKIKFLDECIEEYFYCEEWCVELNSRPYGGPYKMEITLNGKTILLEDIYVGEVWLAAGQSNMEMPLFRTEYGLEEAKHSYKEKIRFMTLPRRVEKNTPLCGWHFEKTTGEDTPWQIASEESSLHFTAIGYYAAKEIQEKLGCAVGMINCSWGGMPIETFIKREYFNKLDCLKPTIENYNKMVENLDWEAYLEKYHSAMSDWQDFYNKLDCDEVEEVRQIGLRATVGPAKIPTPSLPYDGPYFSSQPGCIFDSMLSSIVPFALAGVLWYQGESNNHLNYADKYLLFMECLRNEFKHENMQFYAVELASFSNYWEIDRQTSDNRFITQNNWALTREEQQRATEIDENNYLVTSMGLGDPYDIHPIQKKELAHRMVLKILKYTYGFDIYADQPLYKSSEFEGSKVIIKLSNSEGLFSRLPMEGVNIFVCDETKQLKKAKVVIENEMLVITCNEVEMPIYVRYGFDYNYSGCHIYNKAGLPLAPFRCQNNEKSS